MTTNLLIGKVIRAVWLADDKQAIKFDVDGGDAIVAHADGDSCSTTWIENIENVEAIIGSPVLSADDIEMPEREYDHSQYDVVAFYGFKIATVKGECVIDYRNDSNGYYGGSLRWPSDSYHYGGVYGQNISKEVWKLVGEPQPDVAVDPCDGSTPV